MDARERQAVFGNWYDSFDETTMQLSKEIEDGESVQFPAHFDVCDLCDGAGHHVNPSIDSHGISADEMYEDPNFAEDYFSGVYDVECSKCCGKRVVPVLSWDRMSPELQERAVLYQREHCSEMRERESELRYGY